MSTPEKELLEACHGVAYWLQVKAVKGDKAAEALAYNLLDKLDKVEKPELELVS